MITRVCAPAFVSARDDSGGVRGEEAGVAVLWYEEREPGGSEATFVELDRYAIAPFPLPTLRSRQG